MTDATRHWLSPKAKRSGDMETVCRSMRKTLDRVLGSDSRKNSGESLKDRNLRFPHPYKHNGDSRRFAAPADDSGECRNSTTQRMRPLCRRRGGALRRRMPAERRCTAAPNADHVLMGRQSSWAVMAAAHAWAVKIACSGAPGAAGGGFDGTERAGTRSDGRKQGRNSADGCGEDRAGLYETRETHCTTGGLPPEWCRIQDVLITISRQFQ